SAQRLRPAPSHHSRGGENATTSPGTGPHRYQFAIWPDKEGTSVNQDTVNYAGFTPRPSRSHLAWAIAMMAAVLLGAAIFGLIFGYVAKSTGGPASDLITLGTVGVAAIAVCDVIYFG